MPNGNGTTQWGDGMSRFVRDYWLIFILLTGGAVWGTNVNSAISTLREERQTLVSRLITMQKTLSDVRSDVSYIKGKMDATTENEEE